MNSVKGKKDRVGRIVQMHANQREEIKECRAGDIAALIGMKDVTTGDTPCSIDKPIILERMDFPEPVISVAVEHTTNAAQEKMVIELGTLSPEHHSRHVMNDQSQRLHIHMATAYLHRTIIYDTML